MMNQNSGIVSVEQIKINETHRIGCLRCVSIYYF
jgi:hypothetical protein